MIKTSLRSCGWYIRRGWYVFIHYIYLHDLINRVSDIEKSTSLQFVERNTFRNVIIYVFVIFPSSYQYWNYIPRYRDMTSSKRSSRSLQERSVWCHDTLSRSCHSVLWFLVTWSRHFCYVFRYRSNISVFQKDWKMNGYIQRDINDRNWSGYKVFKIKCIVYHVRSRNLLYE